MKFNVLMLAFNEDTNKVRTVDVPDTKLTGKAKHDLGYIFHFGQNDFQNDPSHYSVSMGDVIEYNGEYFLVKMVGYQRLTSDELDRYKALPFAERLKRQWTDGETTSKTT